MLFHPVQFDCSNILCVQKNISFILDHLEFIHLESVSDILLKSIENIVPICEKILLSR